MKGEVDVAGRLTDLEIWNHQRFLDQHINNNQISAEELEQLGIEILSVLHTPVLLEAVLEWLRIRPEGTYVDGQTAGTAGSAGAPSGVENFIPLYSGGLCEAVKLMAPSAFSCITAYEIAGVGAASAITRGDFVAAQDFRGDGAKSFAEKTGIAANDDTSPFWLLRFHVARNSIHRTAHIFESKFLGHHRAPSRCAN